MEINTNRKENNMERRKEIYEELKQDEYYKQRYDNEAGVYKIKIEDNIVYIGKSRNLLQRLADHIAGIESGEQHKYQILRQAKEAGLNVQFDAIYYSNCKEQEAIDVDIGYQEAYYINHYKPALNQQIPYQNNYHSCFINENAKRITLDEILNVERSDVLNEILQH